MDRVLTIGGIRSRPFDMECFRVMFDDMTRGDQDAAAFEGLVNLFAETEITADALTELPAGELMLAMAQITLLFKNVRASEERVQGPSTATPGGHPILSVYRSLMRSYQWPPSIIDRQDPSFLLLLVTETEAEVLNAANMTPEERIFYGL